MSEAGLRTIVLTYGSGEVFQPLLASLASEGIEPGSVLIVHNPARAGEAAPDVEGVETVLTSHNLGYAAAMNVGIRRALEDGAERLLLLTHDARFRPGSLRTLLAAGEANPGYGVLGPVLIFAGTEEPFSFGGVTDRNGVPTHRHEAPAGAEGLLDSNWLDGGTLLLRADVAAELSGFDERLWSYMEDAELCLRARRSGRGVAVVLGAHADQEPGSSKRLAPWAFLTARNGIAYAREAAGARGVLVLTAANLITAARDTVRAMARALHLRDGDPVEPWALAVGTARGVAAFYLKRWGPPPVGMPGGGDITNTEPPAPGHG